jgi:hypothetical protein
MWASLKQAGLKQMIQALPVSIDLVRSPHEDISTAVLIDNPMCTLFFPARHLSTAEAVPAILLISMC